MFLKRQKEVVETHHQPPNFMSVIYGEELSNITGQEDYKTV
jgi:hypothetical protein